MADSLIHLRNAWQVDQAILAEEEKVVIIRFGRDYDPECMQMDHRLASIQEQISRMAVIYVVDIDQTPDFNVMYELYDPVTVMFFYRKKHIQVDLGTGNNNKINFVINNKEDLITIIECVYTGARRGRGIVFSPKDFSTKYNY
ncbi:DIM1 family protein, putative [Entamoeba histolytica HM-1:IMSS-B]|uniref:DIM1 family protein, putative n=9 Tax=Entamoeba TaxID=5758 RepID=C4LTD9_ENTH1|nr:mitosis protein dim1, putative [Entamoeba dispar SAW760]XP_008855972.1 DIM1 family protein, putative [Entamoeba nuttalli P19]XP_657315.1 DIM1 family protein, putative [Entamoeba histolytica HM-1:IMSS]EMD44267.1 mitosis protein dim1, putative [Entamoeba histolytica KU27]EMH77876.1 DIM1 family protein, putative [Entamoeba histolytica HM-1:IMSS-B]EMS13988.1 mitosis protein dim1, putative [Entamoeba histolytica HM-3:IMSS]ENY65638.1 mitosis protein dim1, putative [Entamoeba histolytica HM-1:IMS|eukprot:EDR27193.1 mitosis protein dim1, putative [Entamoeba dispar SAW760]